MFEGVSAECRIFALLKTGQCAQSSGKPPTHDTRILRPSSTYSLPYWLSRCYSTDCPLCSYMCPPFSDASPKGPHTC